MNETILLLENGFSLVDGLTHALQESGFRPEVARTVKEANVLLAREHYNLLLLDVTLPGGTGLDVCRNVRSRDNKTPILFLTASDKEVHVIRSLDYSGNGYITKPFRLGELCPRTRTQLRRTSLTPQDTVSVLVCGDLIIDRLNRRAVLKDIPLELTGAEYKLLSLLVQNADQTLTRDMIFDKLQGGTGKCVDDSTLSVYIRRLREKVGAKPPTPEHLITIRDFGYQRKEGSS